jgi:hypothetical protein
MIPDVVNRQSLTSGVRTVVCTLRSLANVNAATNQYGLSAEDLEEHLFRGDSACVYRAGYSQALPEPMCLPSCIMTSRCICCYSCLSCRTTHFLLFGLASPLASFFPALFPSGFSLSFFSDALLLALSFSRISIVFSPHLRSINQAS